MREALAWMQAMELRARDFYLNSAEVTAIGDAQTALLKKLAADEQRHSDILEEIRLQATRDGYAAELPVTIDDETRLRLAAPVERGENFLTSGRLTRESLLQCVIDVEFSELNDVFLYAVNMLSNAGQLSSQLSQEIDDHKSTIMRHIRTLPDSTALLRRIAALPSPFVRKMLVVDDAFAMTQLLKGIFSGSYVVTTAANGQEALDLFWANYYDIVISDIEMPVMNGLTFYEKAAQLDPFVKDRWLFFSGSAGGDVDDFVASRGLKLLSKPSPVREIQKAVQEMVDAFPVLDLNAAPLPSSAK